MRKKIWRMSEGIFEKDIPSLHFEPNNLKINVSCGELFESSFTINSSNGVEARGLVYSTNPYVYTLTPAFNTPNAQISYQLISNKLKTGDVIEGEFIIICNGFETSIPFSFTIVDSFLESSIGPISSLIDFANLARRQWREAYRLFYSDDFAKFIETCPLDIRLLYRGFRFAEKSSSNLEEFLSSASLKEKMTFDLDESDREYSFVESNIKESIEITRSTWGHTTIKVSVDNDFVSVEKDTLTSDFFLGSQLSMNYYIHKEKLHSGKNYATISFDGMGTHKQIVIKASTRDFENPINSDRTKYKKSILKLWRCYEDYRLRKISKVAWAGDTIDIIRQIMEYDYIEDPLFLRLVKTQAMIVSDRKQDALWEMKKLRKDIVDKRSVHWAYLLYLGALMEPEESYVRRLTGEIEGIFRDNPEDVRLFWLLSFLREEYIKDPITKLKAIRQWIISGYDSPALFVEAYELFLIDPYLLSDFDDFTIKVLRWARRHGSIKTAVADRLFDLLPREKAYSKDVFNLITEGYRVASRSEYLNDILAYLLKFRKYDLEFVEWYEAGIKENLKVTGLYEGYLLSLPINYIDRLPVQVARYFVYGSNISYEKTALIFSNIIIYKNDDKSLYEKYIPHIRLFAIDQMKLNRIDDNLAIIYQDILDSNQLDAQIADLIADLLNSYKILCLRPRVSRIIVFEEELCDPFVAKVYDKTAYVSIITNEHRVFLEMEDGRLITDERSYYIEPMMNYRNCWDKLKSLSERKLTYFLKDFPLMDTAISLSKDDLRASKEYLFSPIISKEYIYRKMPVFISLFKDIEDEETILKALLYDNRFEGMDTDTLNYMAQLFILDDKYEEAEKLLRAYYCLDVDPNLMLRLLDNLVKRPRNENGEFVLELCIWLLRQMYYTSSTLSYLNDHYIGSCEDMMLIFKLADRHSVDVGPLAERIIVQALYTEQIDDSLDPVFMTYCELKSNSMIREAYLTYWSHHYLVEDKEALQSVFAILFQQERVGYNMNDACRYALMKHLIYKNELNDKELSVLDSMVREHVLKNIYFPFYRQLRLDLVIKYHLYDKMYTSYHGNKGEKISVRCYRDGEDCITLEMPEVYNGLYVRAFVLFFGETLRLEIFNENEPDVILLSDSLTYQDILENNKDSRFGLLNNIESAYLYHNDEDMILSMEKYQKLSVLTDLTFDLL